MSKPAPGAHTVSCLMCTAVLSLHKAAGACSLPLRGQLKCDGTRAETRIRLSAKRTSPFKSAGASVQSTTGSRGVRISDSNAGYTMFRDSVRSTGYTIHSPVSPSLPLPCVTVFHHISTGLYLQIRWKLRMGGAVPLLLLYAFIEWTGTPLHLPMWVFGLLRHILYSW
jgi:hypothetical protein